MRKLFFALLFGVLACAPRAELTAGTPAPEFPKDAIWLGTNGQKPTMAGLKGKVVLIDFWEYTCINCIRTFPHLKELYARYHPYGLEIIGVHKGEFAFASDPANVERAYKRFKLPYPALVDAHDEVWKAYNSNSWPNSFLIDRKGVIQLNHQGEGKYAELEEAIQKLLQKGHRELDFSKFKIAPDQDAAAPDCGEQSEEIYVGYERGASWGGQIANGEGFQAGRTVNYTPTDRRVPRGFFVQGPWKNNPDDFESVQASTTDKPVLLGIMYRGRDVYTVFNRAAGSVSVVVTRDGKPIPEPLRGKDVRVDGKGQTVVTIDEPRMYYIVSKEDGGAHELKFYPQAPGVRICSFTFGNKCQENFDRL